MYEFLTKEYINNNKKSIGDLVLDGAVSLRKAIPLALIPIPLSDQVRYTSGWLSDYFNSSSIKSNYILHLNRQLVAGSHKLSYPYYTRQRGIIYVNRYRGYVDVPIENRINMFINQSYTSSNYSFSGWGSRYGVNSWVNYSYRKTKEAILGFNQNMDNYHVTNMQIQEGRHLNKIEANDGSFIINAIPTDNYKKDTMGNYTMSRGHIGYFGLVNGSRNKIMYNQIKEFDRMISYHDGNGGEHQIAWQINGSDNIFIFNILTSLKYKLNYSSTDSWWDFFNFNGKNNVCIVNIYTGAEFGLLANNGDGRMNHYLTNQSVINNNVIIINCFGAGIFTHGRGLTDVMGRRA